MSVLALVSKKVISKHPYFQQSVSGQRVFGKACSLRGGPTGAGAELSRSSPVFGCGPGPAQWSRCQWCSGRGRSCLPHPPSPWSAGRDERAAGRCQYGSRLGETRSKADTADEVSIGGSYLVGRLSTISMLKLLAKFKVQRALYCYMWVQHMNEWIEMCPEK